MHHDTELIATIAVGLSAAFVGGLVAVGLLLVYQHAIVRPDDLSRVNRAFFQANAVISIGLLVVVVAQIALR